MQGAISAYNLSIPLKMTLQAASDSHESWHKGMLQSSSWTFYLLMHLLMICIYEPGRDLGVNQV